MALNPADGASTPIAPAAPAASTSTRRTLAVVRSPICRRASSSSVRRPPQHRNKAQAMSVLAARIRMQQRARHESEAATASRWWAAEIAPERIRTYNFPQGRVTDHRINLTLYKLDAILEGALTRSSMR